MSKEVRVTLDDDEHKKLVSKKGELTWKEALIRGCTDEDDDD
jgi:hypothetical protein